MAQEKLPAAVRVADRFTDRMPTLQRIRCRRQIETEPSANCLMSVDFHRHVQHPAAAHVEGLGRCHRHRSPNRMRRRARIRSRPVKQDVHEMVALHHRHRVDVVRPSELDLPRFRGSAVHPIPQDPEIVERVNRRVVAVGLLDGQTFCILERVEEGLRRRNLRGNGLYATLA